MTITFEHSLSAITFADLRLVYASVLNFCGPIVVKLPKYDLTLEIIFNDKTHILTSTVQETDEIQEWHNVLLEGELFQSITNCFSQLYFHAVLA